MLEFESHIIKVRKNVFHNLFVEIITPLKVAFSPMELSFLVLAANFTLNFPHVCSRWLSDGILFCFARNLVLNWLDKQKWQISFEKKLPLNSMCI